MSAARIVLLVFGILFAVAALVLLVGGGILMAFDSSFKDDEGYVSTGFKPVESDSALIVTQQSEIRTAPKWKTRKTSPITLKIEAYNDDRSSPVFIGIVRESDISRYLKDRPYDEITGFDFEDNELETWRHSGSGGSPLPLDQSIWVSSASGTGVQTLTWDIASGDYSLVIMNADGSAPVHAHASFGARVAGIVNALGIGLIVGGAVALVIGGVMIFFAARGW
jgi:hypothetical protein